MTHLGFSNLVLTDTGHSNEVDPWGITICLHVLALKLSGSCILETDLSIISSRAFLSYSYFGIYQVILVSSTLTTRALLAARCLAKLLSPCLKLTFVGRCIEFFYTLTIQIYD